MKRLSKYMVLVMVLLMVVVLMTGCKIDGKVTGGGRMETIGDSDIEGLKCTFGFNAQGDWLGFCEGFEFKGQFQFNDHAGTKLHCDVLVLETIIIPLNTYKFTGMDKKTDIEVVVYVQDNGQPGAGDGDGIRVEYQGSVWEGLLEGGNIVIH